jgi:hypothetical protein
MTGATIAFILMTAAMLGLALLRIKYWRGGRKALESLARAAGGRQKIANLPSTPGPL